MYLLQDHRAEPGQTSSDVQELHQSHLEDETSSDSGSGPLPPDHRAQRHPHFRRPRPKVGSANPG